MQNFIVLEFTRNASGNIAVTPSAKETEQAAFKKYYEILSRAADSNSPVHGATMLNWDGYQLNYKYFVHEAEPAQE